MSKADEAYKFITDSLGSGKTILVSTPLRVTKITPKTAAKWEKAGHKLFKLVDDVLYMATGNTFVRIVENDIVLVKIEVV